MIGTDIGPYRVVAKLGEGGMGQVFRARDQKLNRDVAVKILPAAFLGHTDRVARFEREARALAALNHPHIATIYGLEQNGSALVMELVEGEDLARRLQRGPLALSEALSVARQIAGALEAAHEHGIIHRDLKPANVIVRSDGMVKVIDFGLARMAPADESTAVTMTSPSTEHGMVLGTGAYMSPEQARGRDIDKRTDIWAFGAVLFELLTGTPAFAGANPSDLLAAVAQRDIDWSRLPAAIPPGVRALIERCLQVDVTERLRDVGEARVLISTIERQGDSRAAHMPPRRNFSMIAAVSIAAIALAGVGTWVYVSGTDAPASPAAVGDVANHPKSLAVLPFENHSADAGDEYFSDGLTEELLHQLAQSPGLRVAARMSSFAFKGKTVDTKEIASRLEVEAVVTGSVRRSGSTVRVTAQLVQAADGRLIWSQQYERDTSDAFKVQDEIARAIAVRVGADRAAGDPAPTAASAGTGIKGPGEAAFDLYLRGLYQWNLRTEDGARASVDLFTKAIALAPSYARAHGSLAVAYAVLGFYDYMPPREAFMRARDAARQALTLDPTLGEARSTIAYVALYHDWDLATAEREFRQAIGDSPRYAVAHQWYANALTVAGRFDEAAASMRTARELDPLAPISHAALGWVYLYSRDFSAAERQLRQTLTAYPEYFLAHLWLGQALLAQGRHPEALQAIDRALEISPGALAAEASRLRALAIAGRAAEARSGLERLSELEKSRYVAAYPRALVHVALGDRDRAFTLLDRAVLDRAHSVAFLQVDPGLDPIRQDPRFALVVSAAQKPQPDRNK